MVRIQNKQAGFNIVELLVIIAAVGVLGVGGWFVYQHDRTKLTGASANGTPPTSQTNQQATPPAPTTTYLDIKEWGVRLTLNSTTASLYYYIKPDLPDVAYLSLRTIAAIAPDCAADKFSLGAISRLTPAEHESALSDPTKGIPGTIQIGNYWYGYSNPQGGCTDGTPTMESAVSNAAPNFNRATLQNTFNTLAADPTAN